MKKALNCVKKWILIWFIPFIFLFCLNPFVYGEWTSVSPPPVSSGWNLNGVHFTSSGEGWAVGDDYKNFRGVLLHYSAGTWTSVSPPAVSTSWGLEGVYFASPDEGWAVGRDSTNSRGVLLHYSGGTWSSVNPPSVSANWTFLAVNFPSSVEGWAVGADYTILGSPKGVLLHYMTGAWSSVSVTLPSSPAIANWDIEGVHFTTVNDGWAGGGGALSGGVATGKALIFHYLNGIWVPVTFPCLTSGCSFHDIYFHSSYEGWGVGDEAGGSGGPRGGLFHYLNGTWTSVSPPPLNSSWWYPNKVHLATANEGWAVGLNRYNWPASSDYTYTGVLLHYSGGVWTAVSPPEISSNWYLNGVHFTSPAEGWAVGDDRANHTGVLLHFTSSPVSQDEGTIGTEFTITGSAFGTKKNKVLFGNTALKILEWTDGSIRCSIPKAFPPGSYDVIVQPYKASSITFQKAFTIRAPEIDSLDPSSASVNDQVTINGSFFGTRKGKVTLGGKNCRVLRWTMDPVTGDSEIQFVVPKGLSVGAHELNVTNGVGLDAVEFPLD
jgi:hypothetical protein